MKYEELKDKQKLYLYIPLFKSFYYASVTEHWNKEGFTISVNRKVEGHEISTYIRSQKDLDNYFFVCKRQKITDELYQKAQEHYEKNKKEWKFKSF